MVEGVQQGPVPVGTFSRTCTSSSATPSSCRGPMPWSAWRTVPA